VKLNVPIAVHINLFAECRHRQLADSVADHPLEAARAVGVAAFPEQAKFRQLSVETENPNK